MSAVTELPKAQPIGPFTPEAEAAYLHGKHSRILTGLHRSILAGHPVVPWEKDAALRLVEALSALINSDNSICMRLESKAHAAGSAI